ncbi:MAG TPA: DsbA family protein [Solirubrobacteraceae bacterium]|nr:DsbA family protein [Solirubrobacteraceae bacterium]
MAVEAYYYTDPACPWSWAAEPAMRRLMQEFGSGLRVRYVMAGMAREFGDPEPLARSCIEAGLASGMPVDPRIWWEGAPRSSYPAGIAVKAAAEQGCDGPYLRRLREGLLCRRRKLDNVEALVEEARGVPGIDVERFRIDCGSHALLEAFGADLELGRAVPEEHHGEGAGRVKLPSVEFRGADGAVHGVYGPSPYETLRAAALAAGAVADASAAAPPPLEDALRRWGTMATVEVAEVCSLPGPRVPAALWQAALEWRVRAERVGTGELWTLV